MKYPVVSFSISLLIFVLVAVILSVSPFKHAKRNVAATVEVDAFMINEVVKQKVNSIAPKPAMKKRVHEAKKVMQKEKKIIRKEKKIIQKVKKDVPGIKPQEKPIIPKEKAHSPQPQTTKTTQNSDPKAKSKALILYGPLPKIPDHLREEAFRSQAMARFYINEDGSSRVKLIKPCDSPELNYLLLKKLAKWKFSTSEEKSVQDIRVNFMVE